MRDTLTETSDRLLEWYDVHARALPWRVPPAQSRAGVLPDPYPVWLSEVMLQQTTVAAVAAYFQTFTTLWPRIDDLAAADDAKVMAAWAGLGYYARARNLLKCARVVVRDFGGVFPSERRALLALPGIGPYTAAAISAFAFGRSETVVDGNVERVMARLFAVTTPLPTAKPELAAHAGALTPDLRAGDYAQAVMDLGATVCTPRNPACARCPLGDLCQARRLGIAAELPVREMRKPKPVRYGIVYVARDSGGGWLLQRRPDRGLLGGMLGWPGSDWTEEIPVDQPPFAAKWCHLSGDVRHTFTHFHLVLSVMVAPLPLDVNDLTDFEIHQQLDPTTLPTVMRKVHDLANSDDFPN